ncbi:hypothetical protein C8A00DRAFT_11545 [Chaetomidium leptoderma]|uniref:Uncharacterized protein n=1 Tax=Chaetomidium leptoderma TaxID=669021 RepID=A0AAN7A0K7_9PEZI|nr:hypothetical protein C8A00DRAFT_11545 [Chaetomidium leptoderma]
MTTRNLNRTWRDTVFAQYAADHAAVDDHIPFPLRYLIHAPEWKRDIFIEIPDKIDVAVFRRAVLEFCVVARRRGREEGKEGEGELLVYEGGGIKVRPRRRVWVSGSSLGVRRDGDGGDIEEMRLGGIVEMRLGKLRLLGMRLLGLRLRGLRLLGLRLLGLVVVRSDLRGK